MAARGLMRFVFALKRALLGEKKPKIVRPPDPRIDNDPWLAPVFDALGERYQLGQDKVEGIQILCRTGRERFKPMRVYLQPASRTVATDYDVRIRDGRPLEDGRSMLDRAVSARLQEWGLQADGESVEEWGGQVLTRRYRGDCPEPQRAAEAVRFLCQHSEHVLDTSME